MVVKAEVGESYHPDNVNEGDTVTDEAFVSTTQSHSTADGFLSFWEYGDIDPTPSLYFQQIRSRY